MATIVNTALSSRGLAIDTRPRPDPSDRAAVLAYAKDHPETIKLELAPGPNSVDDELWLRFCESPFVAQMIDDGTLIERDDLCPRDFADERRLADERRANADRELAATIAKRSPEAL